MLKSSLYKNIKEVRETRDMTEAVKILQKPNWIAIFATAKDGENKFVLGRL